jgi:hypothetical protein
MSATAARRSPIDANELSSSAIRAHKKPSPANVVSLSQKTSDRCINHKQMVHK